LQKSFDKEGSQYSEVQITA